MTTVYELQFQKIRNCRSKPTKLDSVQETFYDTSGLVKLVDLKSVLSVS